jgi:hypothetical protein
MLVCDADHRPSFLKRLGDPQNCLTSSTGLFRAGLGVVRPPPDGDIYSPISNVRFTSTQSAGMRKERPFPIALPTARLNSRLKWYTSQKPQVSAICASGASLLTISD